MSRQCHQKRVAQTYGKKVKPKTFQEGDLVLNNILPFKKDLRGKFKPNYEGPFVVTKVLTDGTL